MGLDITLTATRTVEVFDANITHNLTKMADAVGLYEPLWRPEECGVKTAEDLIPFLETGLDGLKLEPERFRSLEVGNGWGTYDDFIPWLEKLLKACKEDSDAQVQAFR